MNAKAELPRTKIMGVHFDLNTSMHSSRMRTASLLPVSPSMHYVGGGGSGVSASVGWCMPACTEANPPPISRMTDRQV